MSGLLTEAYVNDSVPQRKAAESAPSINMICNILNFLDASPMTLFESPLGDRTDRDRFNHENFRSLVTCVIAPNESVRRLAASVAKRLLVDDKVLPMLRASKGLDFPSFKTGFWRLT